MLKDISATGCKTHTHREVKQNSHGISIYHLTFAGTRHNGNLCSGKNLWRRALKVEKVR